MRGAFAAGLDALEVDSYLLPEHPIDEQLAIGAVAQSRGIEPVLFLHLEKDLQLIAASELEEPVIYRQSADLRTGGTFDSIDGGHCLPLSNPAALADRLETYR